MTLSTALKTGDLTALPSRRDEDWRWTDLRGLLRTLPPAAPAHDGKIPASPFAGLAETETLFVNGRRVADAEAASGVVALRFVALADKASQGASHSLVVKAGETLVLLESHEGRASGYVSDVLLDIAVGEGAFVERIVLVEDDAEAVNVVTAEVVLAPGARYAQTVLTGGARRQRIETRVNHPGAHAQVRLDGVYLLDGQRHADQTTVVTHAGVDGITSQLTKGMAADQARGVFQGRIVVAQGADQTDARMGHHALILSDKAEIDAKPELLIFADDVSCAHGNTIGALDENALFYAEQRGIPEVEAKAMLTEAFVGEVVDRIEHEGAREIAAAWVAHKLGGVR
ncbi:Fe-S cluster assembly protein SufD [Caulobacter sp. RHG1]|uniref:Fe-S cluster assembly protein SufD n=1 Tax=Caulobacter sp. (strain RHG1) TaxID=2545762 RepID=UPI001556044E|nr:Fe-S cluster assembly protein SufD [Caulobacter sp. RHG1]NQE64077.1 Iron-sulfur cluster assembly protein SufD [Caulobacter sp. RHG1]